MCIFLFTGHPESVEHALKQNMDYILGITVLDTSMILWFADYSKR